MTSSPDSVAQCGRFCRNASHYRKSSRARRCQTDPSSQPRFEGLGIVVVACDWPNLHSIAESFGFSRFQIAKKGRGSARPCANSPFLMGVLPLVAWKIRG